MMRIFLYHGEAYGNLGDEAMLLEAVERIRKRLGDVSFVVHRRGDAPLPDIAEADFVETPSEIVAELADRLRAVRRICDVVDKWLPNPLPVLVARQLADSRRMPQAWRRLLQHIRRCDAVYMVGAANLNDYARYTCVLPKWLVARAAGETGIPVIASAQMVGPIRRPWVRRMICKLIARCESFSIRDGGVSHQQLGLTGRDAEAMPIVGDEAFGLAPAGPQAVGEFLRGGGVSTDRPFGLVQFRSTDYVTGTSGHYRKLADALSRSKTKRQLVFLPMSNYLHDDAAVGRAVREMMSCPERLTVLPRPADARMARGVVAAADWVMSLSYHVQVFAIAAGKPLAALSSGPYYALKAEGMRLLLDGQLPVRDLSAATVASLVETIEGLDACAGQAPPAVSDACRRLREVNDLPIEALATAVAGRP